MRSRAVVFRQVSLGLAVYGPEAGPQGSSRALGPSQDPSALRCGIQAGVF